MKNVHSLLTLLLLLLLVDAGFSREIKSKFACWNAKGSCWPLTCPWPLAKRIGECIWPVLRCCLSTLRS
uniref:Beta-defensin-like domain-containing protein n=1 Tax=Salvator merianae TaxID=96440 RepID=A0A8D0CC73_SALMN